MDPAQVRFVRPADRDYVRATLADSWGETVLAGHGELIDAAQLPALIAWRGEERAGLLTYRPGPASWEIVTIDATSRGAGVGTALLDALRARAQRHQIRALWLVTTNENTNALRFYQRYGFDLVELRRDAVAEARKLKPGIPRQSDGIPIRHELLLELAW